MWFETVAFIFFRTISLSNFIHCTFISSYTYQYSRIILFHVNSKPDSHIIYFEQLSMSKNKEKGLPNALLAFISEGCASFRIRNRPALESCTLTLLVPKTSPSSSGEVQNSRVSSQERKAYPPETGAAPHESKFVV